MSPSRSENCGEARRRTRASCAAYRPALLCPRGRSCGPLALGADLGGNATAVGASANVVVVGIALRAAYPISFWEFTRKGLIVTAVTVAVAAPYLWLRYFLLA